MAGVGHARAAQATVGSTAVTTPPPMPSGASERSEHWPPWGIPSAVTGFVAGLVGALVVGSAWFAASGEEASLGVLVASLVGLWAGYLGTAVILSRTRGTGNPMADVGLRIRWSDLPLGVATGLVTSVVVVRLVYLVLTAAGLVTRDDLDRLAEPAQRVGDLAQGPGWLVLALFIGIGAPVVEEIYYRGLLQPALIRRLGPAGGIATSAVLFGAAHQQVLQFPALAVFGAVLGYLAWRAQRLGPAIAAHIAFNALTLVQLAVTS